MILHIINSLTTGGAEKQLLLTARAQARLGMSVCIWTLSSECVSSRLHVLLEDAMKSGVKIIYGRQVWKYFGLLEILYSSALPVVWSWGRRSDCAAGILSVFFPRISWICCLRSAYAEKLLRTGWFFYLLDNYVSFYVGNSRRNIDLLGKVLSNINTKSFVLRNAMDLSLLAVPSLRLPVLPPDVLKVGLLGNIKLYVKGYDLLGKLVLECRKRGLNFEFHVAGRGDDLKEFMESLAACGAVDSVHYHGAVEDPYGFLSGCHVFLLSSRVEGMPNALFEAMALGLPCVATDVGDVASFAEESNGILCVPVGDIKEMASGLESLAKDWPAACRMGQRARMFVQDSLSESAWLAQLEQVETALKKLDGVCV